MPPVSRFQPTTSAAIAPALCAHRLLGALTLFTLALCPLVALRAQAPAMSPPHRAAAATAALTPGAAVRVAMSGARARVTGRMLELSPDTLVIAPDDGAAVRIAFADVDTVWRATRGTKQGAIAGAILGGVALAGLGVIAADALCETSDCSRDQAHAGLAGGVIGAAGGALLGAALGSLAHTWQRVYDQRTSGHRAR